MLKVDICEKVRKTTQETKDLVVSLYKVGKSFSEIGRRLKIDRHVVPHLLVDANEPLRIPFQGTRAEWSKLYEKTPKGFLMRSYRNMQSRVSGIQKNKAHLYKGLSILARNDFYAWAWDNQEFWRLYKRWAATDFDQKLTPSINRIDSNKGYTLDNIEWLTHSVNSSLGGSSLKRKANKTLMEVFEYVSA